MLWGAVKVSVTLLTRASPWTLAAPWAWQKPWGLGAACARLGQEEGVAVGAHCFGVVVVEVVVVVGLCRPWQSLVAHRGLL